MSVRTVCTQTLKDTDDLFNLPEAIRVGEAVVTQNGVNPAQSLITGGFQQLCGSQIQTRKRNFDFSVFQKMCQKLDG